MTREEFAAATAVLEAGVNHSLTSQAAEVWYSILGDLPAESLQVAVRRYLAEAEYPGMPPVGKIRRLAVEDIHGLPLTAGEAWDAVLTAVRRHGFYDAKRGVDSLDPLTRRAMRAVGGFVAVCDCTEISILAGQFRRAYESLENRQQGMLRLPEDVRPRISQSHTKALPEVRRLAEQLGNSERLTG